MRPVLFDFHLPVIGQLSFPSYGVMLILAFMVCVLLARRAALREGLDVQHVVDLGLVCLVLAVAGARVMAVLTDGQLMDFVHLCTDPTRVDAIDARVLYCTADAQCGFDYLCDTERNACYPPRDCLAALKFWQGGLTFYGGLLLAVPGGLLYCRRKGLPLSRTADLAAPLVMLGLAIGRVGCFLAGCCYGAATEATFGVKFPHSLWPRHPTQLYEAAVALAIFALLTLMRRRTRGPGELFGWMMVLYGAARFALELVRADPRGALGPLSTSQVISIPLVLLGGWLILRARRRLPDAANPGEATDRLVPGEDRDPAQ